MSTIPEDVLSGLQMGWTRDFRRGVTLATETYIGDVSQLSSLANSLHVGSKYTPEGSTGSYTVTASRVEKIQSDKGKWTLAYGIDRPTELSSEVLDTIWSCTVSQYQFPLEKYLDPQQAAQVRKWEESSPDEQYAALEAGETAELSGRAYNVAKLKFSGTNEVIRCYPQATKVSLYPEYKSDISPNLNTIDDEPNDQFEWSGDNEMSWLKLQFDWVQQTDGTWQLTESWQGYPKKDGGWNSDLYDSWEFYHLSANNG